MFGHLTFLARIVGGLGMAVALSVTPFGPTQAAPTPSKKLVPVRDLDLADSDDRRKLDARIRRAAHTVCAGHRLNSRIPSIHYRRCVVKATRDAQAQRRPLEYRAQLRSALSNRNGRSSHFGK